VNSHSNISYLFMQAKKVDRKKSAETSGAKPKFVEVSPALFN